PATPRRPRHWSGNGSRWPYRDPAPATVVPTNGGKPMVGIVLISHSRRIAEGAAELVGQIARGVRVIPAGGTEDGRIGTSTDRIAAAIAAADTGDGVLLIADLGSSV